MRKPIRARSTLLRVGLARRLIYQVSCSTRWPESILFTCRTAAPPPRSPTSSPVKAATTTIPIVFSIATDPVAEGLVASLNRPGGNATGVIYLGTELVQKQVEKLHEMVPSARVMAVLVNPSNPVIAEPATKDAHAAARALGLQIHVIHASTERDVDTAFVSLLVRLGAAALVVSPDPFFINRGDQIAA